MVDSGEALSVRFLGVDACTPTKGGNTASYLVDGRVLVDTGWYLTDRLLACDVNPLDIEAVAFTHCHHDHILGLPQLFFYYGIKGGDRPDRPLHVYGPAGEIQRVVDDACCYLQFDRYTELNFGIEVHDVAPGDAFELSGLRVTTCEALHAVPALSLRFENATGATAVFSGDTRYNPGLLELARGAGLLVHEASYGPVSKGDDIRWGHSGAPDAAEIARQAGVGRLALVHCGHGARTEALAAARPIFLDTFLPAEGEVVCVPPRRGQK
ncbi:MBL fold metallo-hydrolase [Planctomycetota bacterium]